MASDTKLKARLNLEALETREVPAADVWEVNNTAAAATKLNTVSGTSRNRT